MSEDTVMDVRQSPNKNDESIKVILFDEPSKYKNQLHTLNIKCDVLSARTSSRYKAHIIVDSVMKFSSSRRVTWTDGMIIMAEIQVSLLNTIIKLLSIKMMSNEMWRMIVDGMASGDALSNLVEAAILSDGCSSVPEKHAVY